MEQPILIKQMEQLHQALVARDQLLARMQAEMDSMREQAIFSEQQRKRNYLMVDKSLIEQNQHIMTLTVGEEKCMYYLCNVGGLQCVMKEITFKDAKIKEKLVAALTKLEQLPYHENLARYFFHNEVSQSIRIFTSPMSCTLRDVVEQKELLILRQKHEEPFGAPEIAQFATDIARGLAFLHAHNILHRNLKTDVIFVQLNQRRNVRRLFIGELDSSAKVLEGSNFARTLIGTPSYMSPEVLNLTQVEYGFPCDIWSFGMVLYELLTLKRPYASSPLSSIPSMIMSGERPKLDENAFSHEFQPLIKLFYDCTSFLPKDRPNWSDIRMSLLDCQSASTSTPEPLFLPSLAESEDGEKKSVQIQSCASCGRLRAVDSYNVLQQSLLQAISAAHRDLSINQQPQFGLLLQKLIEVTKSNCGSISVVQREITSDDLAITNIVNSISNTINPQKLYRYVQQSLRSQQLIASTSEDAKLLGFHFLVVPLFSRKQLVGLLEVFRAEPYDSKIVEFMEPITNTLGNLIDSYQAQAVVETINQQVPNRPNNIRKMGSSSMLLHSFSSPVLEEFKGQLREAKENLEQANQAKNTFITSVSHEICTPLNAIIGMADCLLGTPLNSEQVEYTRAVMNGGKMLQHLMTDFLEMSTIETNQIVLEKIEYNLWTLLESVYDSISFKTHQKPIEMILDIDSDIPKHVIGDPARLQRVLLHLVDNGVKFTEKGEVTLRCKRSSRLPVAAAINENSAIDGEEDYFLLIDFAISDTGIGIEEKAIPKMLTDFRQLDGSNKKKYGGVGLGLQVTTRILGLMGGYLNIQSVVNVGSTVTATLPIQYKDPKVKTTTKKPTRNSKVLIADPSESSCLVLTKILSSFGITDVKCFPDLASLQTHVHTMLGDVSEGASRKRKVEGAMYSILFVDSKLIFAYDLHAAIPQLKTYSKTVVIMQKALADTKPMDKQVLDLSTVLLKPIKYSSVKLLLKQSISDDIVPVISVPVPLPVSTQKDWKIMIVDDNLINLKVAGRVLSQFGFTCFNASCGREALEYYAKEHVDLIFMDIMMPEMDGYEVTRRIRQMEAETNRKPVAIVALTANSAASDKQICMETGMNDFITKPLAKSKVEVVLNKYLILPPLVAELSLMA